jgi:hypothetical protein
MKKGTGQHRKTKRLMRLLKVTRCHAVGILNCIWELAAEQTPRGDIGAYTDEELADELDWQGDPHALVSALEDAGWIDKHAEYRYVIHDWSEHCEDTVHRKVARAGQVFADGSTPNTSRLTKEEKSRLEGAQQAHDVRTPGARNAHDRRTTGAHGAEKSARRAPLPEPEPKPLPEPEPEPPARLPARGAPRRSAPTQEQDQKPKARPRAIPQDRPVTGASTFEEAADKLAELYAAIIEAKAPRAMRKGETDLRTTIRERILERPEHMHEANWLDRVHLALWWILEKGTGEAVEEMRAGVLGWTDGFSKVRMEWALEEAGDPWDWWSPAKQQAAEHEQHMRLSDWNDGKGPVTAYQAVAHRILDEEDFHRKRGDEDTATSTADRLMADQPDWWRPHIEQALQALREARHA